MSQNVSIQLPSMPGSVVRLLQVFADPDVSIDDVVAIISSDPSLAGRILKAANSSAVGTGRDVTDLKRAAMLLGRKSVSTLALSFSLSDRSMQSDEHADAFRNYWNQSLLTGITAALLADRLGGLPRDEAFLVGLLLRIGRLGALSFAAQSFGETLDVSKRFGRAVDVVPLESMGMSCNQLSLEYLTAWALPASFLEAVSEVQRAEEIDRSLGEPDKLNACATRVTDILRIATSVGEFFTDENSGVALARIHELLSRHTPDTEDFLQRLIRDINGEFATFGEFLNVDASSLGSPAELHAKAMAQMTDVLMAPEDAQRDHSDTNASDVGWLKDRVRELSQQLTMDTMTSIHNRRYFDQQLEQRIATARLTDQYVAVLFVDINDFKTVNDTYGHEAGDDAIRTVATTLKKIIRSHDIVARYGGDEFVILCEMNQITGLQAQSERLTQATSNIRIDHEGTPIRISIAIGGAIGCPTGDADFGARLLRLSDEAMYEAKETRSNPCVRVIQAKSVRSSQ